MTLKTEPRGSRRLTAGSGQKIRPAGTAIPMNDDEHNHACVGDKREFLVPSKQSLSVGLAAMQQRLSRSDSPRSSDRPSIIIDRLPARTTALHGITGPELERLSAAVRYMTLHCRHRRSALWLATTNKGAARSAIANVWKRITRLQTKYDLPAYSVAVFETKGGLHAHITFIGTRDIARRLQSSSVFGHRRSISWLVVAGPPLGITANAYHCAIVGADA